MKIFFLHIPKTAGQSVHQALIGSFGNKKVCPARVNDQLRQYSLAELDKYTVFSGHLDWRILDCLSGKKYVFTILREPLERILSFYFFLRNEATRLQNDLDREDRQGLKAVLGNTPREYFCGCSPHLRNFLDSYYDNVYTYYFAGRSYNSRGELNVLVDRGVLTREKIQQMAFDNLCILDAVFTLDDMPRVFSTIAELSGKPPVKKDGYRMNVNKAQPKESRMDQLLTLGADTVTLDRIRQNCAMDQHIWKHFAELSAAARRAERPEDTAVEAQAQFAQSQPRL